MILRTSEGIITSLAKLKQIINVDLALSSQMNDAIYFITCKYVISIKLVLQGQIESSFTQEG